MNINIVCCILLLLTSTNNPHQSLFRSESAKLPISNAPASPSCAAWRSRQLSEIQGFFLFMVPWTTVVCQKACHSILNLRICLVCGQVTESSTTFLRKGRGHFHTGLWCKGFSLYSIYPTHGSDSCYIYIYINKDCVYWFMLCMWSRYVE